MTHLLALGLTLFVAVAHVGFMVLETFLWTKPIGLKIFAQSPADAEKTRVLAQNQGVYNGALAVAIAWAALTGQAQTVLALLAFVVAVGIYGGITAKRSIIFTQALPAAIALALNWFAQS